MGRGDIPPAPPLTWNRTADPNELAPRREPDDVTKDLGQLACKYEFEKLYGTRSVRGWGLAITDLASSGPTAASRQDGRDMPELRREYARALRFLLRQGWLKTRRMPRRSIWDIIPKGQKPNAFPGTHTARAITASGYAAFYDSFVHMGWATFENRRMSPAGLRLVRAPCTMLQWDRTRAWGEPVEARPVVCTEQYRSFSFEGNIWTCRDKAFSRLNKGLSLALISLIVFPIGTLLKGLINLKRHD